MSADLLQHIQELQFTDRGAAEALLVTFIGEMFPLDVIEVELRPLAVSLNSFNGYLTLADGRRLFFKTHTEADNVIGEYYRAETLANAAYPVIQPLYSSTEAGRHLLIYELIEAPSVFDVAWSIENGNDTLQTSLMQAQQAGDDELWTLYQQTYHTQSAAEAAEAPIHQLFYHRLVGGRLERFYGPLPGESGSTPTVVLPDSLYPLDAVRSAYWTINGQSYDVTLDDLIAEAIERLHPAQAGPAIIGHGDAHNGNVFLTDTETQPTLLYFDPAFAGRHHPLLDLTKPLFHNVFAMWMYFPQEKAQQTQVSLQTEGQIWVVEHDYNLPSVRHMFWQSKIERVLRPALQHMQAAGDLRDDWRRMLKLALMCCPLLTMNLADNERFPPPISLLGLSMAVEMGAESRGQRSMLDQTLDELERSL